MKLSQSVCESVFQSVLAFSHVRSLVMGPYSCDQEFIIIIEMQESIQLTIQIHFTKFNQEFIIKERRESIQLSQYPVQTHCVKFVP